MNAQFIGDGAGGARWASRDKMPRSSRCAERLHFVSGRGAFSVSPFGETPKGFRPAPAERRALKLPASREASNGVCSTKSCASSFSFFLLPASLLARAMRDATGAARITGTHNAGREAACIVPANARKRSARGTLQIRIARWLILRFTFESQSGGTYAERRTSCVLYDRASCRMRVPPTRLPGGFAPVDPDQRGSKPPCWIPPGAARRGAIA